MHFELPDFGKDLMSDVDEQQIENREKFKISFSAGFGVASRLFAR